MKSRHLVAASGFALAAFFASVPAIAQGSSAPMTNGAHVDANGMPTNHSTPAEQAATAGLNNSVSGANAQADAQANQNSAQYQQQQQQYQGALADHQAAVQQNQSAVQQYQDQSAMYDNLRTRYAAERAAYHRGIWPSRYSQWTLEDNDNKLVGQRVEIISGDRVGTVTDVAHNASGRVVSLRVALDSDKIVWIDREDVRYDRADGIVMTNLDNADLHRMADERM